MMTHNRYGSKFSVEVWGASHTPEMGVQIYGIPRGIELSEADFEADIARRRSGAKGTTARRESDIPTIVSGVSEGKTTGEVVEIVFRNSDTRSSDYSEFEHHPRPSHVDFVARAKYGNDIDLRGSGQFSGRMTLLLVAAGVVAKKVVGGLSYTTRIVEIGGSRNEAEFADIVAAAAKDGDSVGGVVECRASGVKVGLGEPFFDSVESVMSHLLFSIPGVKGVAFGDGFAAAAKRGSERNDAIVDASGRTATNNEGGINGGIANGNDIVVRVAIKPTPSISLGQQTYDFARGELSELIITGRHDSCIARRAVVVVEAMAALALAELKLRGVYA